MNRQLLLLVVAVALAGCVAPGFPGGSSDQPENESNTTQRPTLLDTMQLDSRTIFTGSSTSLLLELQNTRSNALRDVEATIGNRGTLGMVRRVPETGQAAVREHQCGFAEIAAGDGRRCVWRVMAGDGIVGTYQEDVTFPLTTFLEYTSTVTMPDRSLDIVFEPRRDIQPNDLRTKRIQAANQDIQLVVQHTTPVAAEDGTVKLSITARNIGEGDVIGGDQKQVDISFTGTLADAQWNAQETTCVDAGTRTMELTFDENARSTTQQCTIALSEPQLAGKTFFLRPHVEYRYLLTAKEPLTVMKRQ